MEHIRDFLIYHYHANRRVGEPLWDRMRRMAVPECAAREDGAVPHARRDGLPQPDHLPGAQLAGDHDRPRRRAEGYDPLADLMDPRQLEERLQYLRAACAQAAARMPTHAQVLERIARRPAVA